MLVVGIGIVILGLAGIGAWMARARNLALTNVPPDDPNRCAACGSVDVMHPAEGVYRCTCGFEGGPGLPAYAWKRKTERISAMSQGDRDAMLARALADARLQLTAARGDFDLASESFREGEAIVPLGKQAAARKTELYQVVRDTLPSAERCLMDAIGSVETARHILRGGDRMSAWYDRLHGSRETALTITGMQATSALGVQLREVGDLLTALEREIPD